jgi:DNA-directed RNA polymerase subunit K/omega
VILGKYERTRIIGTRATQLAMGATSTVECPDEVDPLRIAEKELAEFRGLIRCVIGRASFLISFLVAQFL